MTLVPVFDASVTSNANAAAIEAAVNTAASALGSAFKNSATVRFNVSWGSVGGKSIPAGDGASSVENLSGPYSFSTIVSDLRAVAAANPADPILQSAVAHLPKANPAGSLSYEIPYGEAQAIGLLPPAMKLAAGAIGFSTSVPWDMDPSNGITAGTYDLEGAATHEIMEVLGRMTGLQSTRPTLATPLDLFRYSAAGVSAFSYSSAAYFSLDGGSSALQRFNYSGSGDRSDIASQNGLTDAQAAFFPSGIALTLSAGDLEILDALGWGGYTTPNVGGVADPYYVGTLQGGGGVVPEPRTWWLTLVGFGLIGASARSSKPSRCNPTTSWSGTGRGRETRPRPTAP